MEKAARKENYVIMYIIFYQYLLEMYAKFSMLDEAAGKFKFQEQTHGGTEVSIIILPSQCKPQHRLSLNSCNSV